MRGVITKALLLLYRLIGKTGLMQLPWSKTLFWRSYFLYKKYVEDPFDALIKARPEVFKGGHILDIGANIGYTTSLFSSIADPQFKVYSFEPDASNFAMLTEVIGKRSDRDRIVPVFAAVGPRDGTIELWHNEAHHADHRILTSKLKESLAEPNLVSTVPLVSVDHFLKSQGIEGPIKFIKIDVQGYELAVCEGMAQTLENNPDVVIAMEYAPDSMHALGFDPDKLIEFFRNRDYFIYLLERNGRTRPVDPRTLQGALERSDYVDLLISKQASLDRAEPAAEASPAIVPSRQEHATSRYKFQLLLGIVTLMASIWLSSGTMAPAGATLYAPLVSQPCGYLFNSDHPHHKAAFLMLDGAEKSQWAFSVVLRRILFPLLAYPFMKMWGFELGGFFASLLLHVVTFLVFIAFLRKEIGEKAAVLGMWLLATYPGISYWAALPYSYVAIVPCSLLATILLWKLNNAREIKKAVGFALLLGVLFTAYDFLPIFGLAALLIVILNRRYVQAVPVLLALLIPQLISNQILKEIYGVSLSNSNTDVYYYIIQSYLHRPDYERWVSLLADVPRVAIDNYLFSSFLFLPALFVILFSLNLFKNRIRISVVEKSIALSVLALFLFNNLAPPYDGWQLRGDWVARMYQPVFTVLVLFAARKYQQSASLGQTWKRALFALCALTVLANASIAFGPMLNNPFASSLYYHFYKHPPAMSSPTAMSENLRKYGRRPLGFCDY